MPLKRKQLQPNHIQNKQPCFSKGTVHEAVKVSAEQESWEGGRIRENSFGTEGLYETFETHFKIESENRAETSHRAAVAKSRSQISQVQLPRWDCDPSQQHNYLAQAASRKSKGPSVGESYWVRRR